MPPTLRQPATSIRFELPTPVVVEWRNGIDDDDFDEDDYPIGTMASAGQM